MSWLKGPTGLYRFVISFFQVFKHDYEMAERTSVQWISKLEIVLISKHLYSAHNVLLQTTPDPAPPRTKRPCHFVGRHRVTGDVQWVKQFSLHIERSQSCRWDGMIKKCHSPKPIQWFQSGWHKPLCLVYMSFGQGVHTNRQTWGLCHL